jgi:hypothetical protein
MNNNITPSIDTEYLKLSRSQSRYRLGFFVAVAGLAGLLLGWTVSKLRPEVTADPVVGMSIHDFAGGTVVYRIRSSGRLEHRRISGLRFKGGVDASRESLTGKTWLEME